ncbi:UrcA family protein [Novosphingobium profundi]|uniref:UrcA family protein n=1 Tax=Novosphingobium profundi TaxID=1774954 RepID=UPI001BD96191|nr:UrcA family protein [Novosphingobium profundi]MBT0666923.1 UrcA family protein [Novosphingobium profundi]
MRKLAYALCALGGALLTTPALADVVVERAISNDLPTVLVRYTDLDLDSADGLATLDVRLGSAVKRVCGYADLRQLREHAQMRECRVESLGRAYADRDTMLAARLEARGDPSRLAMLDARGLRVSR